MKAEEIREWHKAFEDKDVTAEVARARARIEIAAQLAETNDLLKYLVHPLVVYEGSPWVWLTFAGNPFVVDRNEVTGVAPLFDDSCATSKVVIGMRGQSWSKTCDGSVAEVCAKLGIPLEGQ